jgi:hypothetical protein
MQPSNDPPRKRDLSEISHLFLSSVRERQTQGAPRPVRTPPPKPPVNIELNPEEPTRAVQATPQAAPDPLHTPPVTAMIASHLNGKQFEAVKDYARQLASRSGRVGLIELDGAELRLSCFDPSGVGREGIDAAARSADAREISEALAELNCDVNHWLLLVSPARGAEALELLRDVSRWVTLSTSDHDGIVSTYRLLKGISESTSYRPALSLALLDSRDQAEAARMSAKLVGVCKQFLGWNLDIEEPVVKSTRVSEHLVLRCHAPIEQAASSASQWKAVGAFVAAAKCEPATGTESAVGEEPMDAACRELVADTVIPTEPQAAAFPRVADEHAEPTQKPAMSEVIDLDGVDATADAVLAAMLKQPNEGAIECPVRPPMCPQTRLAVTRDRSLVLFAAAEHGLSNLRGIGLAYRWLMENRSLVAMALPQLAIDAAQLPKLRLLIDQADLTAEVLQPMLQNGQVSVVAYRPLRWGAKTGLLLEAA